MSADRQLNPGYWTVHMRLRRRQGPASNYTCSCDARAREWAYLGSANELVDELGRRYSTNPADYRPMCKPCHTLFDGVHRTHCPHGHEYAGENVYWESGRRFCRACKYARNSERERRKRELARGGRPKFSRGEAVPSHKLTEHQVREIRRRLMGGESRLALAVEFGLHRSTVGKIDRGEAWAHLWESA